jgi:hypothetical protein
LGLALADRISWIVFGAVWFGKFLIDWILMTQARKRIYGSAFCFPIISAVIYPFWSLVVALYSVAGPYYWKGRKF